MSTQPSRSQEPGAPAAARTGRGHEPGSPAPRRGDPAGYALVVGSYLLFSLTPILMVWTTSPPAWCSSCATSSRRASCWPCSGAAGRWPACCGRVVWRRFVLMAALDASQAFAYFYAVRVLGVAVATFIYYLQPLWVALLAPRILHVTTERVVYIAMPVAIRRAGARPRAVVRGHGLAVLYGYRGRSARRSRLRPVPDRHQATDAGGLQRLDGHRHVPARRALPAARGALADRPARTWRSPPRTSSRWRSSACSPPPSPSPCGWMAWPGVRVQHSAILGLLSAVASPVFAFLLLGQGLSALGRGRRHAHPGGWGAGRAARRR